MRVWTYLRLTKDTKELDNEPIVGQTESQLSFKKIMGSGNRRRIK